MNSLLDVDQLRTFLAIVETGSFTRAAEIVHKTQSAVSMQMKRLEERLERPIFARDGRASKLTEDGDRLLDYARRIVKLNVEALAAFSDFALTGRVRLGVPDDYADRYLPEIMARFSRAYPGVELSVICEPSLELVERIAENELDLAIITDCESSRPVESFRRERLLWVSSNRHTTHREEPLPLALGRPHGPALPRAVLELERRRGRGRRARRARGLGVSGIRPAAGHARARHVRRFCGIALVPGRIAAQSAPAIGARRGARRTHHFLAGQFIRGGRRGGVTRRRKSEVSNQMQPSTLHFLSLPGRNS